MPVTSLYLTLPIRINQPDCSNFCVWNHNSLERVRWKEFASLSYGTISTFYEERMKKQFGLNLKKKSVNWSCGLWANNDYFAKSKELILTENQWLCLWKILYFKSSLNFLISLWVELQVIALHMNIKRKIMVLVWFGAHKCHCHHLHLVKLLKS